MWIVSIGTYLSEYFFLTFHLFTPLTTTSLKDKNAKFNSRKYKKCDKYIQTLIMNCIGEKLWKKGLKIVKYSIRFEILYFNYLSIYPSIKLLISFLINQYNYLFSKIK